MREIRYLRNNKIYSGNTRLKKSQKAGQKQTPQEFCGDLFITGGARNLLPLAYERPAPKTQTKRAKNREKQGIFAKNGTFGNLAQPTIEYTRRFSVFLPCPA